MKSFYFTLFLAASLPCVADISTGSVGRPAAPVDCPAAQPDYSEEAAALTEAIKLMTDEARASSAQKQLQDKKAAVQDITKRYGETVEQIDSVGPQVEARLQKEVSVVADMAEGKGITTERDKKMHAILLQNIPESGYDASGVHDVGGTPPPTPRSEKEVPPLRPLPPELQ